MTMWVWRLPEEEGFFSNAQELADATAFCVQAFNQTGHPNLQPYANCSFAPVPVGHCRKWVINQIFQHNLVRQGWCGVGLDLRQGRNAWINNWRLLVDPNDGAYADAPNRYNILIRMLGVAAGDTIFLPRVNDYDHFTVVTVTGPYCFEDRSRFTNLWELDFGHVIPIDGNLTKTFMYGPQTLMARAFQAYRRCVSRVTCSNNSGFGPFLRSQNYPFTPY